MDDLQGRQEEGGAAAQRGTTPFILVSGLFLLAYWIIAAFVFITDPYDLRPWGAKAPMPAHLVTSESRVLALAVSKSPAFDLVMIGSSTAVSYTPEQIRAVFPESRNPVNFSYPGGRPKDRDFVLTAVARNTDAARVVVWIDWSYLAGAEEVVPGWPSYLFDDSLINDLRMINPEAISASFSMLNGRPAFVPSEREARSTAGAWGQLYRRFQSPRSMKAVMSDYDASVRTLQRGPERRCEDYPTLDHQLAPALRTLAARGKQVDLVLPAYSVVFYGHTLRSNRFELASLMDFRRCLALAASGLPNVKVWALDGDLQMISDLGNYRDAAHLYAPAALQSALAGIGDPRYRLTPENVDARNTALWNAVQGYRYTNSYTRPETSREP